MPDKKLQGSFFKPQTLCLFFFSGFYLHIDCFCGQRQIKGTQTLWKPILHIWLLMFQPKDKNHEDDEDVSEM